VPRLDALGDRLRAFARPWELVAFVWLPGLALAYAGWYVLQSREALGDFMIFRSAAVAVVHGRSPYVTPTPAALAHFDRFVYPPVAALLFSPFAALPAEVARAAMFAVGLVAIVAALRLLGVEDWRCYGVALVSAPAINSLGLGALTSLLLLGSALAWRRRDSTRVAGAAAAVTAVLKLFLWPLGVWLLATRRWRAVALFVAVALCLLTGGWAAIGFDGLRSYPTLVHLLEQVEGPVSYSLVALTGLQGASQTVATVALSLAAIAAVWFSARGPSGDRAAFAVAVLASLVATPLLWLHYLLLLYVPIALYRPRLSGLWFVPLVLWVTPTTHSHGITWRIAVDLLVVAFVALRTMSSWLPRSAGAPRPVAS